MLEIQRIDHVAITIGDIGRSRRFYEEVLGLKEVERPRSFDFPGAWYRLGNMDLHLVGRAEVDAESRRHFCFWVKDVHAAARHIRSCGYEVIWDTKYKIEGVDRFFTYDPDRNRIEFQGEEDGE